MHGSVVDRVVGDIQAAIDQAGVRARLVLSGKGEWRFLDIVAANAGKLAALECALFSMLSFADHVCTATPGVSWHCHVISHVAAANAEYA